MASTCETNQSVVSNGQTECCNSLANDIREGVKNYYGKVIITKHDFKLSECSQDGKNIPKYVRQIISTIHPAVQEKNFGCGLIAPTALDGCDVLDLGSGAGMDCFILSKMVGQEGHVTGLDMTDEQVEFATKYIPFHMEAFEFQKPNVNFVKGYIENLTDAGLKESQFNVIISNCVMSLSPSKKDVLREAYRVLKPGGEIYFSDMYVDKEVPEHFKHREDLWGEGIAGALSWQELHKICQEVGFCQPQLVTSRNFMFHRNEITDLIEGYHFISATYRLFKLPENARSDPTYVTYNGKIPHQSDELLFDHMHTFKTNKIQFVDGEVAAILMFSRYRNFFTFADESQPMNPFHLADLNDKSVKCGK